MKEGWEYKKLGEVCEILNGFAFKSNKYVKQGIRVMRITNVQKGLIVDDDPKFYPFDEESSIKQYLLNKGDLLMSLTGNVGRVGLLQQSFLPAALNQRVACLRLSISKLQLEYLFHFLNSERFEKDCVFNASGIAQKNLSTEWLKKYIIPIPPLSEQQRIVEELDLLSSIIEKKKAQLKELDSLAQSIFYDMFGNPILNDKGWEFKTIKDIVTKEKNSLKRGPFGGALKKEIFVDKGYLVYEQYHALNNDYTYARYFISEEKYKEMIDFSVKEGDIIISCSGVNLGKLSIIPSGARKGIINQALLKLTLNKSIFSNIFFIYIFQEKTFKEKYFGTNRGCAIPNMPPMSEFKRIKYICPPLSLQQQFAEKVEAIEHQKELIKQSIKEVETLFNSRMDYYFN